MQDKDMFVTGVSPVICVNHSLSGKMQPVFSGLHLGCVTIWWVLVSQTVKVEL